MRPVPPEPLPVVLYTRNGCHLCDDARRALDRVARRVPLRVEEVDIDRHEFLRRSYSEEIPVVWVRGAKVAKHRIEPEAILRRAAADNGGGR